MSRLLSTSSRQDAFAWVLLFLTVVLSHHFLGLLPDVAGSGDTAKLQLVASRGGSAHFTGYSLWTLAAECLSSGLRTFFPGSHLGESVSYGPNLLSSLFAATALAFLFATFRLWELSRRAGFALCLFLAWTPSIWSQSVRAEVYTLHLLFLTALIFFLVRWRQQRRDRDLALACGLLALAFSNHLTSLFLALGALLFIVLEDRRQLGRWPLWVGGLTGSVATLAAYQTLVWRTLSKDFTFLETQAVSLGDLLHQLILDPYHRHLFETNGATLLLERIPSLAGNLIVELHLLLPLAALGLLSRRRPEKALFLVLFAGPFLFAASISVEDAFVYAIPALAATVLLAGLGLNRIQGQGPLILRSMVFFLLPCIGLGLLWPTAWREMHSRRDKDKVLTEILDTLPPEGTLVLSTVYDTSMGLLLRTASQKAWSDIRILHTPPQALALDLPFSALKRSLLSGEPLRQRERDLAVPPPKQVFCFCPRPGQKEELRQRGFEVELASHGLLRLRALDRPEELLPRALLVHELVAASSLPEAADWLGQPTFDARTIAIHLDAAPPSRKISTDGPGPTLSRILNQSFQPHRIELETESTGPSWLVMTESFPERWQFSIDGGPAPRLRLDLFFAGVSVPPGRHRVVFAPRGDVPRG